MADISKITTPNGDSYDLKDAQARNDISEINAAAAGSATNPVYFSAGRPSACTYELNKTVPSDALFTDTNTQRAFYCLCESVGSSADKTVACSDSQFVIQTGTIIVVTFTETNTATAVTLNVNSLGSKSIYVNNAIYTESSENYCGYASRQMVYMYNGSGWAWIGKSWDNGVAYSVATTTTDGLMSSTDKTKLDTIAESATANSFSFGTDDNTVYLN